MFDGRLGIIFPHFEQILQALPTVAKQLGHIFFREVV
jgi:hypothetical protein